MQASGQRLDSQPGAIHSLVPSVLGPTVTRGVWSDIIRLVSVEVSSTCILGLGRRTPELWKCEGR